MLSLVCEWPLIARAIYTQLSRVNKNSSCALFFSKSAAKVLQKIAPRKRNAKTLPILRILYENATILRYVVQIFYVYKFILARQKSFGASLYFD